MGWRAPWLLVALASGCGLLLDLDEPDPERGQAADRECERDAECDDGLFCTKDRCHSGRCTHGDACNDRVFCTVDTCLEEEETCDNTPDDRRCGGGLVCSKDRGCIAPSCTDDPDCDNGLFCDGEERCVDGDCQPGRPPCDDGYECTEDVCDETNGCAQRPKDALCDDGLACTEDVCVADPDVPYPLERGCKHRPDDALCTAGHPISDDDCVYYVCVPDVAGIAAGPDDGCRRRFDPTICRDGQVCGPTGHCVPAARCSSGGANTCDDDNPCNGIEDCNENSVCESPTSGCPSPVEACYADWCDESTGRAECRSRPTEMCFAM